MTTRRQFVQSLPAFAVAAHMTGDGDTAAAAPAPAVTPSAQAPAAPLDGVAALLEQAKRAADTKQTRRALDLFRRVLAETPAHPEALGYVEETLRQQRKFEELSDVLLAAARHGSQSTETRKAQLNDVAGICESKLKNYDKAIDAWKLIVQLDRGDRQARERLATLLEKQKRFDDLAAASPGSTGSAPSGVAVPGPAEIEVGRARGVTRKAGGGAARGR
jgi:tetratricopeptide (TPR) repeat protein